MKNIITKIENNKILVTLHKAFYENFAIMSAAHGLTDSFVVMVENYDDENTAIYFEPKKDTQIDESGLYEAAREFCNRVLDEQLRLDIEKRYGNIRDMIVKQAFSPITEAQLSKEISANPENKK
jgi:His-Xaa-Ser system protein HxsD